MTRYFDAFLRTHYVLDQDNEPVPATSLREWAAFMQDPAARRVAFDSGEVRLVDGTMTAVEVSTVFLGLDHGSALMMAGLTTVDDDYEPVLWETMVFGGPHDQDQERYTSHADAIAGHVRWCVRALGRFPGRE